MRSGVRAGGIAGLFYKTRGKPACPGSANVA
jgi:hypothetical protein